MLVVVVVVLVAVLVAVVTAAAVVVVAVVAEVDVIELLVSNLKRHQIEVYERIVTVDRQVRTEPI